MREHDNAVTEHLLGILICVYVPELRPVGTESRLALPRCIESYAIAIASYGNRTGSEGSESIGYNSQSNINLANCLIGTSGLYVVSWKRIY